MMHTRQSLTVLNLQNHTRANCLLALSCVSLSEYPVQRWYVGAAPVYRKLELDLLVELQCTE